MSSPAPHTTGAFAALPPRERMVLAALAGLRANGLAGAAINQVIASSGAPKGSLYHYFPGGKLELVREALQRFGEQRRGELLVVLAGGGTPDQKLRRLFRRAAKGMAQEGFAMGCAVAGVALDLDAESEPLRPVLAAQIDSWTTMIATALAPLPGREALARFTIIAFEGALVQARATRSQIPLLEAGDQVAQLARAPAATA